MLHACARRHADLALTAIDAGKHVICAKPFTRDATEGRKVLAAAEEAGVVHLMGSEFRWNLMPYTKLAETFRDLILGRAVAPRHGAPTFADGVAAMAVLDAIRRCATEGTSVRNWILTRGRGVSASAFFKASTTA